MDGADARSSPLLHPRNARVRRQAQASSDPARTLVATRHRERRWISWTSRLSPDMFTASDYWVMWVGNLRLQDGAAAILDQSSRDDAPLILACQGPSPWNGYPGGRFDGTLMIEAYRDGSWRLEAAAGQL